MSLKVPKSCYIAKDSTIVGNVILGDGCSVWHYAVIRGDENNIFIGDGSNVQDCAVVHVDYDHETRIGKDVSIGHGAVVHGCQIDDEVIIGMNSSVLSGAVIGKGCIIGANALVPSGMEIPDHSIAVGVPAKIIKQGDKRILESIRANAEHYHTLRDEHKSGKYEVY